MDIKTIILLIIGIATTIWIVSGFAILAFGLLKWVINLPSHIKEWKRKRKNKKAEEWFKKHPNAKWYYDKEKKSFMVMDPEDYKKIKKMIEGKD